MRKCNRKYPIQNARSAKSHAIEHTKLEANQKLELEQELNRHAQLNQDEARLRTLKHYGLGYRGKTQDNTTDTTTEKQETMETQGTCMIEQTERGTAEIKESEITPSAKNSEESANKTCKQIGETGNDTKTTIETTDRTDEQNDTERTRQSENLKQSVK